MNQVYNSPDKKHRCAHICVRHHTKYALFQSNRGTLVPQIVGREHFKDVSIRRSSTSARVLPDMSAVAAEQFGVRRPEGASLPDDHQLHLTLVDVDQHRGAPLRVHEEDDGEERHLELGAGPDEGAADGLHQAVPAELEVENVVVLIGLRTETRGRQFGRIKSDAFVCGY